MHGDFVSKFQTAITVPILVQSQGNKDSITPQETNCTPTTVTHLLRKNKIFFFVSYSWKLLS